MTAYAAFDINFDTVAEARGFPAGFRDPAFFAASDRFLDLADRRGFRYTLFVVGRDLEHADHRAVVRSWAQSGHEVANHSWSHRVDLGALGRRAIREEVKRAHEAIAATIGVEPRGFTAPGWSTSRDLEEVLVDLGYAYDASRFPSWLLAPALAKMLANHRGHARFAQILRRRDYARALAGSRSVHRMGELRLLPLPANRFRVACWHTLAFVLGWRRFEGLLRSCLRDVDAFYYLMHPADLLAPEEMGGSRMERASAPLELKQRYVERAVDVVTGSGRTIVTMAELAETSH